MATAFKGTIGMFFRVECNYSKHNKSLNILHFKLPNRNRVKTNNKMMKIYVYRQFEKIMYKFKKKKVSSYPPNKFFYLHISYMHKKRNVFKSNR